MKQCEHILQELMIKSKNCPLSPLRQLRQFQYQIASINDSRVSPKRKGWEMAALLYSVAHHKNVKVEKQTVQYLLENFKFSPSCWEFAVRCFNHWVHLQNLNSPKTSTNNNLSVCRSLSSHAITQAIFHISRQRNVSNSWQVGLSLYRILLMNQKTDSSRLKSCRHQILQTLLYNDRWIEALQIYNHTLLQKEIPTPSTTGFLVWKLGAAGNWSDTFRIYQITSRFLNRLVREISEEEIQQKRKEWGTVFSMIVDTVSKKREDLVEIIVKDIIRQGESCKIVPFVLLDGNFIRAAERLKQKSKTEILTLAKSNNLLDYYKIIRGFVSQQRWMDGLRTFCSVMKKMAQNKEYVGLSRGEIGRSRLELLHGSSASTVKGIADAINSVKNYGSPFSLNDSELNCVFSKSLSSSSSTFWLYCLQLFHANFPASPKVTRQPPDCKMISLLLRNKRIPWIEALSIFGTLSPTYFKKSDNRSDTMSLSVAVDALVSLLHYQGALIEVEKLVKQLCSVTKISLPADFLMGASEDSIHHAVFSGSYIHHKTLYFILHNYSDNSTPSIPRPALCLNILMKSVLGRGFIQEMGSAALCPSDLTTQWLTCVPNAVHIEFFRCIQKSRILASDKMVFVKEYLQILIMRMSSDVDFESRCSLYCTVFEAIVVFVEVTDDLSAESFSDCEIFLHNTLEKAMKQYHCLPPFFMFLPNQLDRLLPRSEQNGQRFSRVRVGFAQHLLKLTIHCLDHFRHYPQEQLKPIAKGLLKICCRISEQNMNNEESVLPQHALRVVRWESNIHDCDYVLPSSLRLLYQILSKYSTSANRAEALKLTETTLRQLGKPNGMDEIVLNSKKRNEDCITSQDYRQFSALFGWELGLGVWYKHFPRDVLANVSHSNTAIDFCFSLEI